MLLFFLSHTTNLLNFVQIFQYEAVQPDGHTFKGFVEAHSREDAAERLRQQGYLPIVLKPYHKRSFSFERVTTQDITLLTRQLATLLGAGVPVEEALQGVAEQTEKSKVRHILLGIKAKVLEGFSLAQAIGEYGKVFPELYQVTVSAGEQTGRLDLILDSLANYTEKQQAMKQKIQQALIYPAVMIFVSTAIVIFLLIYVVPTMIKVFTDSGETLPLSTRILIKLSALMQEDSIYLLSGLLLLAIGVHRLLKNPYYHYQFHVLLLKIPVFAYLIRTVNVARYIHTFSMLFAAGVNVLETMRISGHLIQNLPMRAAFEKAAVQVREGRDITATLKETHFVPPMALHLIGSGEKSGKLAEMMAYAAKHLEQEVGRLIETGLTLLEPLMILVMGGVVLFIVLATLLPIFSMEQMVS